MNSNEINMISNNVNGIQSTKKRSKVIQYFKNKLLPQGFFSFKKPTLLNLMRQVGEMNLMQPFFSPMDRLIPVEFQLAS